MVPWHSSPQLELAHVNKVTANRGSSGHRRTHQMSSPSRALPSLKVPVRRRCAPLAGSELIAIERRTKRTACIAPFKSSRYEDAIKTLGFGLTFNAFRTRNNPRRNNGTPEFGH